MFLNNKTIEMLNNIIKNAIGVSPSLGHIRNAVCNLCLPSLLEFLMPCSLWPLKQAERETSLTC